MPGVLAWMGRNWFQIMKDVASFTATVVGNVAANLTSFVGGVASLLTGGGFSFEWTALTDGFESSLKEMPQIAERQIGPLEAGLQAQFDAMQQTVGSGLAAALDGNKAETSAITQGISDTVGKAVAGIPAIKPSVATPDPIKIPDTAVKVDTAAADAALDKTKDKAAATAASIANVGVGSAEQMKRIAIASIPTAPAKATDESAFFESSASATPISGRAAAAARDQPKRLADKPLDGPAILALLQQFMKLVESKQFATVEEV